MESCVPIHDAYNWHKMQRFKNFVTFQNSWPYGYGLVEESKTIKFLFLTTEKKKQQHFACIENTTIASGYLKELVI